MHVASGSSHTVTISESRFVISCQYDLEEVQSAICGSYWNPLFFVNIASWILGILAVVHARDWQWKLKQKK